MRGHANAAGVTSLVKAANFPARIWAGLGSASEKGRHSDIAVKREALHQKKIQEVQMFPYKHRTQMDAVRKHRLARSKKG